MRASSLHPATLAALSGVLAARVAAVFLLPPDVARHQTRALLRQFRGPRPLAGLR